MATLSALDVAKYLLTFTDEESGDLISNLKLQKLLYYAQGYYLAVNDKPLFEEDVLAWTHGPVVKEVWQEYTKYGSNPIPIPEFDDSVIPDETKDFLKEIYAVFGQFSAWKLRNMTHEEDPWRSTKIDEVISVTKMKDHFKKHLVEA